MKKLKVYICLFQFVMIMILIGCRSQYVEPSFDLHERSGEAYSGESRINSVGFFEALAEIERRTDLVFVVSPTILRTDGEDGDRFKIKQSFRFSTDEEAVNALQFAFNVNAEQRGRLVYLDSKEPEIQDHTQEIELCYLCAQNAKTLDLAAELQFMDVNVLNSKINEIIKLQGTARLNAARGWQVSKRSLTLLKGTPARISNGVVSYVERSNLSDYGVRSVNGFDERESGDILELELMSLRSRSAFVKFTLEESKFSNASEKQAIKVETVQALDENWRIVADYFRAEKEDSLRFVGAELLNRKTRFIVVARVKPRSAVENDFVKE